MAEVTQNTGGLENLLPAVFPWKIVGEPNYIRLALSVLVPLPKPGFALVTDDSGQQWTLYLSEESFKFLDKVTIEDRSLLRR